MANVYIQIRCGVFTKEMVVGREYDFSIGKENEKISPQIMLEFLEKSIKKAIVENYGEMFELQ